jgi:hypothetical protein
MKQLSPFAPLRLFYLFSFTVLLFSCKKGPASEDEEVAVTQGVIKGKILLPAGSAQDVNSLVVHSAIKPGKVSSGGYEAEVYTSAYTTQFVNNAGGDVVMMGYCPPQQTDNDITVRSTALALVMNSRAALSLSADGKQQFMNKVLAAPKFGELEAEVESSVKANAALFDATNQALMNLAADVFKSAQKGMDVQSAEPLLINKAGKTVTFSNNTKAHSTVVGIYQHNERVQKIVVEGLQMVPTSVMELLNGYGGTSADPKLYPFDLKEGQYEIRIRTGKPGSDDGSQEHREAFYENISLYVFTVISNFIPAIADPKAACNKRTVLTAILNLVSPVADIYQARSIPAAVLTAESVAFQSVNEIVSKCNTPFNPGYFKNVAKLFSFVDKAFSVLGSAGNLTLLTAQWASSKSAVDECFTLRENRISDCYPIKLTPTGMTFVSNTDLCMNQPVPVYYLNFTYEDPQGLINLSTTKLAIGVNGVLCWNRWSADETGPNSYYTRYPIRMGPGTISVAAGMQPDGSGISTFWVDFQTMHPTNPFLSNRIYFKL